MDSNNIKNTKDYVIYKNIRLSKNKHICNDVWIYRMIMVSNELHIFGSSRHYIFDKDLKELQIINNSRFIPKGKICIYIKSKDIILSAGEHLRYYDMKNYSMLDHRKIKDKDILSGAISTDEKYIVFLAQPSDNIRPINNTEYFTLIYHVYECNLYECNIKFPIESDHGLHTEITIYSNECYLCELISSYINDLKLNCNFPNDIKNIIYKMGLTQYIYLMDKDNRKHWRIYLDELIYSDNLKLILSF